MSKHKVKSEKPVYDDELKAMERLVAKYGEDYEAMSKDLKLNPYQHTANQLRKKHIKIKEFKLKLKKAEQEAAEEEEVDDEAEEVQNKETK